MWTAPCKSCSPLDCTVWHFQTEGQGQMPRRPGRHSDCSKQTMSPLVTSSAGVDMPCCPRSKINSKLQHVPNNRENYFSPTICSIERDTVYCLYICFFVCIYGYGFLSRGFTNWCEILHGSSATSQTGLLLFWGR